VITVPKSHRRTDGRTDRHRQYMIAIPRFALKCITQ